ncbi:CsgG/HfaB family protein [Myxococcaceae bacterium GXIMD 01537]
MSGLGRLAGLVLALLAAPALAAPAPAEGPVAVMPFKNLNQDASLEWLRLGIAETLLSDLRASGRVGVVEREQLDRALTELALQQVRGTEESTAARAGKLVGARTVVLGSFQRAGKQLRLNARFVAVETGLVLGTAKVTGPLERIFALQDGLVARLLGEAENAPRPPRRTGPRVVRAYELYGRALATPSSAERVGLLREAVEVEPGFTYALEDLRRLEARLREHRQVAVVAGNNQVDQLRATFCDTSRRIEERESAARQYIIRRMTARQWWALTREAEALIQLGLPERPSDSVREQALFALSLARWELRQRRLALQLTERLLREFPASTQAQTYQVQASGLISELRQIQEGRETLADALAELDARIEKRLKNTFFGPLMPVERLSLERERCEMLVNHSAFEASLTVCRDFVERWEKQIADAHTGVGVLTGQVREISALMELGRFAEAKVRVEELDALVARHPFLATDNLPAVAGARARLPGDEEGPGEPLCPSGHAPPDAGPGPARPEPGKTPPEG